MHTRCSDWGVHLNIVDKYFRMPGYAFVMLPFIYYISHGRSEVFLRWVYIYIYPCMLVSMYSSLWVLQCYYYIFLYVLSIFVTFYLYCLYCIFFYITTDWIRHIRWTPCSTVSHVSHDVYIICCLFAYVFTMWYTNL